MCDSYLSFTAIVGVVLSRFRILSLLKLTFYTIFSSLVYFHIFFTLRNSTCHPFGWSLGKVAMCVLV